MRSKGSRLLLLRLPCCCMVLLPLVARRAARLDKEAAGLPPASAKYAPELYRRRLHLHEHRVFQRFHPMTDISGMAAGIARPEHESLIVHRGPETTADYVEQGLVGMYMKRGRDAGTHTHLQQRHVVTPHKRFNEHRAGIRPTFYRDNRLAFYLIIPDVKHIPLS